MNTPIPFTNEKLVRQLYQAAETRDLDTFRAYFSEDAYFWNVSMGKKYRGLEIATGIEIYAGAFPNFHRELYDLYSTGEERQTIIVELSLNGTHMGPLLLPAGAIAPTGRNIHVPCCDVITFSGGKVISYHCYIADNILLGQLGFPLFTWK